MAYHGICMWKPVYSFNLVMFGWIAFHDLSDLSSGSIQRRFKNLLTDFVSLYLSRTLRVRVNHSYLVNYKNEKVQIFWPDYEKIRKRNLKNAKKVAFHQL